MNLFRYLFLFFLLVTTQAKAQNTEEVLNNLAIPENLSEEQLERLSEILQNPIDINSVTYEDLQQLQVLSDTQIKSFLNYRGRYGKFLSLYELQAIPGFDNQTVSNLMPFLMIQKKINAGKFWRRFKTNKNHYFLLNTSTTLESRKGYRSDNPGYLGSPYKISGRWKNTIYGDFSTAFLFEKDAGEKVILNKADKVYGFDFYSFHLAVFNRKKIKKLCLGDYSVQFGQGLILGSGFSLGKGPQTVASVRKANSGIKPYSSFSEYGYFRGLALTYQLHSNTEISAFVSYNSADATLSADSVNYFSTLSSTGLHRTKNELSKKGAIKEFNTGGNLSFTNLKKSLKIGVSYLYTRYTKSINPKPKPYNFYDFRGTENICTGIDVSYRWQNFNFFGEGALSKSRGKAFIAGLVASIAPEVDYSLIVRNYDPGFHSFYSNSFSEGSSKNEKGFYQGIKVRPFKHLEFSAYYDFYKFPWLKYQVDAPSKGNDFLIKLSYYFSRYKNLQIQFREESKEKNSQQETAVEKLTITQKQDLLIAFNTTGKKISFNSKFIINKYREFGIQSKGMTLVEDISLKTSLGNLSLRFAVFDTKDYNSRIYTYERDVLYSFYVPAYYGEGVRTSIVAKIKIFHGLSLWLKFARSLYFDREKISSGNEEISGNSKTDVKFQLHWKI